MTDRPFSDKIALVTGASRGIGAATAVALGAGGAHVVLVGRTVGGLEESEEAIYTAGGTTDDADYDLRNGSVNVSGGETHGFVGTPIYLSGHGWQSEAGGNYQLSPTSLGFGKAQRLANFNDDYAAPDVGAHQSGTGSMSFGVNASSSFWVSGTPIGGAVTSVSGGTSTSTSTSTSTATAPRRRTASSRSSPRRAPAARRAGRSTSRARRSATRTAWPPTPASRARRRRPTR